MVDFFIVFYPSRPYFWPYSSRAQNGFWIMLQNAKRRLFSCKSIYVTILGKFRNFRTRCPSAVHFLLVSSSVFSQQINHISAPKLSFQAGLVSFDRKSKTARGALSQPMLIFLLLSIESKDRKSDHVKICLYGLYLSSSSDSFVGLRVMIAYGVH